MPLKLTQRGRVWWIRGTVCGVHFYQTTKLADRKTADAFRKRIEREISEQHVHGGAAPKTFEEACAGYLASGGSDRFLRPVRRKFRRVFLKDISQVDLDQLAARTYPNASPQTRNRQCYTPFIAVWNFAAENDWARARKWRRPRKPKGTNVARCRSSRSGQAPVDYERAAEFVAAMSPAPAMLLTALFYTGLRPIEAFSLVGDDINLAGRWLVIRSSKNGDPRGVPLHPFLCMWLGPLVARAKSDGGTVFRTPRGVAYTEVQGGGGGLKSAINGARLRLARITHPDIDPRKVTSSMSPILDVSAYTGRHTVSTQLVIAGIHPHIKDQILGHAADSMSRHYTHVPQAPLIEAIGKLPVPDAWRSLPWVERPQDCWSRLAEGTGKRTDLVWS